METRNYGSPSVSLGSGSVQGFQVGNQYPADKPSAAPPESASGIRDAISFGEDVLSQLHATISHLESRLDTALTPIAPSPVTATGAGAPVAPMSHVRERIAQMNRGLSDAVSRLSQLRDRVEV